MGTIIQMPVAGDQRRILTYGQRQPPETGALPHFAVTRKISADDARMLVKVTGEVDLRSTPVLAEVLELARQDVRTRADSTEIVVDMRLVVFLSAAGLDVLARASHDCVRDGVGFRVVAKQPAVTRPLTITHLDRPLRLCPHPDSTT